MLNKKLVSFKVFRNFFPLLFLLWKTEKSFVVKNSWNSRGNHSYINSGISSLWTHAIHPMLCDFIFFFPSFLSLFSLHLFVQYRTRRPSSRASRQMFKQHMDTRDQLQQHQKEWPLNNYPAHPSSEAETLQKRLLQLRSCSQLGSEGSPLCTGGKTLLKTCHKSSFLPF